MSTFKNLSRDDKATPVIGPLVSSDRITLKNGLRYTKLSRLRRSTRTRRGMDKIDAGENGIAGIRRRNRMEIVSLFGKIGKQRKEERITFHAMKDAPQVLEPS